MNRLVLVPAVLLFVAITAHAQFVQYPENIPIWDYRSSLGVNLTVLPRVVAEEELRQVPLLDYNLRFGLPLNFSINGRVSSNVIANLASLGMSWNLGVGPVAAGAGARVAFWYGFASFEGFNVSASSWLLQPYVEGGFTVGDVRFSGRADLQVVLSRKTKTDGFTTRSSDTLFGGYGFEAHIEQPFFGNTYAVIGAKLNFSRAMYQAWLAFATFEDLLLYPEFSFAIIF